MEKSNTEIQNKAWDWWKSIGEAKRLEIGTKHYGKTLIEIYMDEFPAVPLPSSPINTPSKEVGEKAKALVNEFYQPLGNLSCNCSPQDMWEYGKKRATFYCDGMIEELGRIGNLKKDVKRVRVECWNKIKQAINNL